MKNVATNAKRYSFVSLRKSGSTTIATAPPSERAGEAGGSGASSHAPHDGCVRAGPRGGKTSTSSRIASATGSCMSGVI